MFSKFIHWFEQHTQQEASFEHTKEIAAAALLYEVIRADNDASTVEKETYLTLLSERFALTGEELIKISQLGESNSQDAVDLQQFTHIINEQCSAADKRDILKDMWRVAYADNLLDPNEEHMIRRMADLLHIPHSHFIQTKLEVSEHKN